MTFYGRQIHRDSETISGYWGLEDGGVNKWRTEDLLGSETSLHYIVIVGTWHDILHLSK